MKVEIITTSKLPVYLLVAFCSSFIATFVTGSGFPCNTSGCGCKYTDANGQEYKISLEGIGAPGDLLQISASGNYWDYYVDTCTTFSEHGCTDATMCQEHKGGDSFEIATSEIKSFGNFVDKKNRIKVEYSPVEKEGATRQMIIYLGCANERSKPTKLAQGKSGDINTFTFNISTPGGCPTKVSNSSDSSGGGPSTGSIIVIVFFVVLVLYLVAGILFMKFKRGATGKEVIPNIEFWSSLPGLIKDGCVFFGKKMKELCGRCCNREGYNEI